MIKLQLIYDFCKILKHSKMIDKKPEHVARKKFNVFGQKLFCDWLQN